MRAADGQPFAAMKLAAAILLVGTGLLAYATSLPAYTDEALFEERYMALPSGAQSPQPVPGRQHLGSHYF